MYVCSSAATPSLPLPVRCVYTYITFRIIARSPVATDQGPQGGKSIIMMYGPLLCQPASPMSLNGIACTPCIIHTHAYA
jgi:hypothetical protein